MPFCTSGREVVPMAGFSNITLGQYYPVDSCVHRLDPRVKILLTVAMIVAVFLVHSLVGYALILGFV